MSGVEALSSVGRELFFRKLLDSRIPIYVQPSGSSFDEKSALKVESVNVSLADGKLVFRKNSGLDSSARKKGSVRIFFFIDSAGYFCELNLSAGITGISSPLPSEINRIEAEEVENHPSVSGKLSYPAGKSNVSIGIYVPLRYDSSKTLGRDEMKLEKLRVSAMWSRIDEKSRESYPFMMNLCVFLSDLSASSGVSDGTRHPLELLHLGPENVALGDRDSACPLALGQSCTLSFDFSISPVIRRSVNLGCSVVETVGNDNGRCMILSVDECREEDARFLSDGLSRFL